MRQRHIKNLEERLKKYDKQIIADPEQLKGKWREAFKEPVFLVGSDAEDDAGNAVDFETVNKLGTVNDSEAVVDSDSEDGSETAKEETDVENRKLFVEVGCGKGQFITNLSAKHPDNLYVAIEGQESVAYHAVRKAAEAERENVRFVLNYVNDARDFFMSGEVDGLYLNFSDPWPKARHEKRRLTSPRMLGEFGKVVKSGGFIEFKTDNEKLFSYSVEQFKNQEGMEVEWISDDLHSDVNEEDIVTTEYEDKFHARGLKIHLIRVKIL